MRWLPRLVAGATVVSSLVGPAGAADDCPPEELKKPPESLEMKLQEHEKWARSGGWGPPEIPGRADLSNADLSSLDLHGRYLMFINLRGADLQFTNLAGAHLDGADFEGADLSRSCMSRAILRGAKLAGAILRGTVIIGAVLDGIDLTEAKVFGTNFSDSSFFNVKLESTVFEPAAPPAKGEIRRLQGLLTVKFGVDPEDPKGTGTLEDQLSGLVGFRNVLAEAGPRDLERDATFVIERARTRDDLANSNPLIGLGGYVKLIIFEWTTGYGRYPWWVFVIMLGFMAGFAVAYWVALGINTGRNGIFCVYLPGSLDRSGTPQSAASATRKNPTGWSRIWCAIYFSVISAFRIGWREVNLGTWIEGMQTNDFRLTATGWPRIVAGVQSLLSVYLFAIWALTEFGRPFD